MNLQERNSALTRQIIVKVGQDTMSSGVPFPVGKKFAIVDAEAVPFLEPYKWYFTVYGYAYARMPTENGKQICMSMHRWVLKCFGKLTCDSENRVVDHINGDRFDNRIQNLRCVSHSVNMQNRQRNPYTASSQYQGVSKTTNDSLKPWRARYANVRLGEFWTEQAAAFAYDEYIRTNLPPGSRVNDVEPCEDTCPYPQTPPRKRFKNAKSQHQGVSYLRYGNRSKRWKATYKRKPLGNFHTEQEAADAYQSYVKSISVHENKTESTSELETSGEKDMETKRGECRWICQHIHFRDGRYEAQIARNGEKFYKSFTTLELAKTFIAKIEQEALIQKQARDNLILRNQDGECILKTSNGEEVLVDEDTARAVGTRKVWLTNGYPSVVDQGKHILLHRFVMKAAPGTIVDHKNRVPFDCRRINLRFVTHSVNMHNRAKKADATSIYRGVSYHALVNKFVVKATKDGRHYCGGFYEDELEAAFAANKLLTQLHGDDATLNDL